MKNLKTFRIAIAFAALSIVLGFLTACSNTNMPSGSEGVYYFVYEKGPLFSNYESDNKITLDGKGKGTYLHKGNTHQIKYEYSSNGDINIYDSNTGIRYNGTLKDGDLLLYDEEKDSMTVTEFLFSKNGL